MKELTVNYILLEDIRCMDMTWGEATELSEDRDGWTDCVARCAELHWMD